MNELLIANYLEQFKAMQEVQLEELRKSLLSVSQQSKTVSTQLINRSLVAMQENYETKEQAFATKLDTAGQKIVEKIRHEVTGLQKTRNTTETVIYSLALICAFILGVVVSQYSGTKSSQ